MLVPPAPKQPRAVLVCPEALEAGNLLRPSPGITRHAGLSSRAERGTVALKPCAALQGLQKLPKAASTEQVETASNNGSAGNSTNPLDFDELTDIIRPASCFVPTELHMCLSELETRRPNLT